MQDQTVTIRAVLHKSTEKAHQLLAGPPNGGGLRWVGKSQVGKMEVLHTFKLKDGSTIQAVDVELPFWLVQQNRWLTPNN